MILSLKIEKCYTMKNRRIIMLVSLKKREVIYLDSSN